MIKNGRVEWPKLLIAFAGLVILSFALAYFLQKLIVAEKLPIYDYAWLAYLIVFVTALVANLTILAPVPFAISVMISAATIWNPLLVALCGAVGGSLGELSGYYAGYYGKKIAIPDSLVGYKKVEGWIQRYGPWAIAFIAFQPIVPFDLGGVIAGIGRMPVTKFLPALFLGKLPKYILLVYVGLGLIDFLPFLKP